MSKKYLFSIVINKKFINKYIKYTISSYIIYKLENRTNWLYIYFNISFTISNEVLFTNFLIYWDYYWDLLECKISLEKIILFWKIYSIFLYNYKKLFIYTLCELN